MAISTPESVVSYARILSATEHDENMADFIEDVIKAEKRGCKQLAKLVERIVYHVDQLNSARQELSDAVERLQEPQTRTSAALKAQQRLLDGMSDRMLKAYAADMNFDTSEFILPDDRRALISDLIKHIAASE